MIRLYLRKVIYDITSYCMIIAIDPKCAAAKLMSEIYVKKRKQHNTVFTSKVLKAHKTHL